jgi:phasin
MERNRRMPLAYSGVLLPLPFLTDMVHCCSSRVGTAGDRCLHAFLFFRQTGQRHWGLLMPLEQGTAIMAEANSKSKARHSGSLGAAFEGEFKSSIIDGLKASRQKLETPNFEIPTAVREFAETGVTLTREIYERLKRNAEAASAVLEATYAKGGKGATDYGRKLIEITGSNSNAAFEFAAELMRVRSFSEMIELSAKHAHRQVETLTEQTKELTALAQKIAAEASEPIQSSVNAALGKDR